MTFRVPILLGALLLGSAGCSKAANVYLVQGGGYGKGVFIVAPFANDLCNVELSEGRDLHCSTQYVFACDIDLPMSQPFCQLVREIGSDRISHYPDARRR